MCGGSEQGRRPGARDAEKPRPDPTDMPLPAHPRGLGKMKTSMFKQRQAELGCGSLIAPSAVRQPREEVKALCLQLQAHQVRVGGSPGKYVNQGGPVPTPYPRGDTGQGCHTGATPGIKWVGARDGYSATPQCPRGPHTQQSVLKRQQCPGGETLFQNKDKQDLHLQ